MPALQQTTKTTERVVGTLTEQELAELQRKAAAFDATGGVNVEELQVKNAKLESDMKLRADSDKKNRIASFRDKLSGFIVEEAKRLNASKFRGSVTPTGITEVVSEAKAALTDEFLQPARSESEDHRRDHCA